MDNKYLAAGGIVAVGLLAIGATFIPGKEGKINSLGYWLDELTFMGLNGAEFDINNTVTLGAECTNLASVALNMVVGFNLTYPDGTLYTESISSEMQPNQTSIFNYPATLNMIGSYKLTVTLYEEDTMTKLDEKTVTFSATDPGSGAIFAISLSLITNPPIEVGEDIIASVTVTNIGSLAGDYVVTIDCDELASPIIRTGTLNPGASRSVGGKWQALSEGTYIVTANEAGGAVDTKSYTVEGSVTPDPEASIVGIYQKVPSGSWPNLNGLTGLWGNITVAVRWKNDLTTHAIADFMALELTNPNNVISHPTPVSGQGATVQPGQMVDVMYNININVAGSWQIATVLDGDTVP